MTFRKSKQWHTASVVAGTVLLLAAVVVNSFGIATARYQRTPEASTVYGDTVQNESTLSLAGRIYDFGGWTAASAFDPEATVVLQQRAPLKGVLRFTFDNTTAQERDISLLTQWGLSVSGGAYPVDEEDGRLELPFSLVISSQDRRGVVHLDVQWIPDEVSEAEWSARYLVTLNPQELCGDVQAAPAFNTETGFLTQEWLRLSLSTPATAAGLLLAKGPTLDSAFAAGTDYYTSHYPQGVHLLRDSAIYLPLDGRDLQDLVIDFNQNAAADPVRITAGGSDLYMATTTQTPAAKEAPLAVTAAEVPLVSDTHSVTFTLTEAAAFHDAVWNNGVQEGTQLCYEVQRLVDGQFVTVNLGDDLTLSAAQSGNGGTVTVAAPTGKQPAGTYQLVMSQTWNGYTVHTAAVPFFIDYR